MHFNWTEQPVYNFSLYNVETIYTVHQKYKRLEKGQWINASQILRNW
jgi:hypothetical protein